MVSAARARVAAAFIAGITTITLPRRRPPAAASSGSAPAAGRSEVSALNADLLTTGGDLDHRCEPSQCARSVAERLRKLRTGAAGGPPPPAHLRRGPQAPTHPPAP